MTFPAEISAFVKVIKSEHNTLSSQQSAHMLNLSEIIAKQKKQRHFYRTIIHRLVTNEKKKQH